MRKKEEKPTHSCQLYRTSFESCVEHIHQRWQYGELKQINGSQKIKFKSHDILYMVLRLYFSYEIIQQISPAIKLLK